jgi:hypothetical protein
MDYQVWKWLDSGDVEFRIHAVSQKAHRRNPALRIGFHLVGRRQQVRFARRCGARMEHLIDEGLERGIRPSTSPG